MSFDPRGGVRAAASQAARAALQRKLPERYPTELDFRALFDERAIPLLREASTVLDVGSGRHPTYGPAARPAGCTYVGLDLLAEELAAAPPGSYDEAVVGDLATFVPALEGRADLAVSWQVLEHVKPLDDAVENLRRYLRPGGHLVAQFSGTFGLFGLLSRLVPERVTPLLLERLFDRPRQTTFRTYYHQCWASALERIGAGWSSFEVIPRHLGGGYFGFSRHAQAAYLAYEEWAYRTGRDNLASYYLVVGRR